MTTLYRFADGSIAPLNHASPFDAAWRTRVPAGWPIERPRLTPFEPRRIGSTDWSDYQPIAAPAAPVEPIAPAEPAEELEAAPAEPAAPNPVQAERVAAWAKQRDMTIAEAELEAAKPFRFEDLNGEPEPEAWGKRYPALPSVDKWRKLANKRELTAEETRAYGASVGAAIRLLQRQELIGSTTGKISLACTAFNAKKHRATLAAAFHAGCAADKRAWAFGGAKSLSVGSNGQTIEEAYEAAMAAKAKRLAREEMREAA